MKSVAEGEDCDDDIGDDEKTQIQTIPMVEKQRVDPPGLHKKMSNDFLLNEIPKKRGHGSHGTAGFRNKYRPQAYIKTELTDSLEEIE